MWSLDTNPGTNYFTEMCSGSEAGSYLRLIDFVYHSTLGLRVIKKREEVWLPLIPGSTHRCRAGREQLKRF